MRYFLLITIFFSSYLASAQTNIDSLKLIWEDHAQQDTVRLKAVGELAWFGYLYSQPDSAFYFAQLQYDLAQSIKSEKWVAAALNIQGNSFYQRGDYEVAIEYINKSLVIVEKEKDRIGVSKRFLIMGAIYWAQGNQIKAVEYFNKSLAIGEELNDEKTIAGVSNNLGVIYKHQGNYKNAIKFLSKSLKMYENLGNLKGQADALNNIGIIYVETKEYTIAKEYYNQSLKIREELGEKKGMALAYNNLGNLYKAQADFKKAKTYFDKSYEIQKEMGDKQGVASSLLNIGDLYFLQADLSNSIECYQKGLDLFEEIGAKSGIVFSLNKIGQYHLKKNNFKAAINNGIRALALAQQMDLALEIEKSAGLLQQGYEKIGNYRASLKMKKLQVEVKDSLTSLSNRKELLRNEIQYKYEKRALADSIAFAKQQEITDLRISKQSNELKSQRFQNIILYSGVALLVLISSLTFYGYKQKSKANELITSQKEELVSKNDEIERQKIQLLETNNQITAFNATLELKIKARTSELEKSIEQLRYYHNDLAHNVRAPLASLMGLVNLIQDHRFDSKENEKVLRLLKINTSKMNIVIKGISENMTIFDEYWEEKMANKKENPNSKLS